ncbi:MAG: hypothetical protein NZM07_02365 [Elioraea sp.]|nr:hypothetical protein [Elioraea sp.]
MAGQRGTDLLGLDRDERLVVIALRRDVDGSHAEPQALRQAAMVSAMSSEMAVETRGAPTTRLRPRSITLAGKS